MHYVIMQWLRNLYSFCSRGPAGTASVRGMCDGVDRQLQVWGCVCRLQGVLLGGCQHGTAHVSAQHILALRVGYDMPVGSHISIMGAAISQQRWSVNWNKRTSVVDV